MIRLASLFQDGAVLQRDMELPVWGKAQPGAIAEIHFDGCVSRTRTSSEGDFIAYLPPHAAGGPFELTVKAGGEELTVGDILVGEVWLASGQSNMEYMLSSDWRAFKDDEQKEVPGRVQERQFGGMLMEPEKFRFFTVQVNASGAPEQFCTGAWHPMTEEFRGKASAVAAWFGLGLQYQLDVPIGIVACSWGGSPAEAWISEEAMMAVPELKKLADIPRHYHYEKDPEFWEYSQPVVKSTETEIPGAEPDSGNQGVEKGFADVNFDDSSWKDMTVSGSWKAQGIAGNGAVWFRKKVSLPAQWKNVPLELEGGSVDKHDIAYFNGHEIGRTGEGMESRWYNLKRRYPIDPSLAVEGDNVVALRGFSFACDGAINGSWFLVNKKTNERISLNGIWKANAEYDRGNIVPPAAQPPRVNNRHTPAILFNGMLRPIIPYAMRGVIWYQGETNASTIDRSLLYQELLQSMIDDWRRRWRQPDLPFIMVQLAGFGSETAFEEEAPWAFLRESQRLIALQDPDTYMVSAIDVGEANDIHPQNKLEVGKRLAMCALHHVYKFEEIVPTGPEVEKAEVSDGVVRLTFSYGEELELRSGDDAFFLAGADRVFYPADQVRIDGEQLVVSSSKVAEPAELRYAWAGFPAVLLYNKAGFPAPSFRLCFCKD